MTAAGWPPPWAGGVAEGDPGAGHTNDAATVPGSLPMMTRGGPVTAGGGTWSLVGCLAGASWLPVGCR